MYRKTSRVRLSVLISALILGTTAHAQDTVVQTLDSIHVFSKQKVLEMPFDDPARPADFFDTGIGGTNYRACKVTAISGLFCLDGSDVVHTPNLRNPLSSFIAITCNDSVFGFDTKKGVPCTAMTVDLGNTGWIGGTKKGTMNSLFEARPVPPPPGGCPMGFTLLNGGLYCVREAASGWSQFVDLTPVDGDFGVVFPGGPGILALVSGNSAVYFPKSGESPAVIKSGKQAWGLAGNEVLTRLTAIQVSDMAENPVSHVLATTDRGRVLVTRANGGSGVTTVFNIVAERDPAAARCDSSAPKYGIRASSKSGVIYITDREFCLTSALIATVDVSGNITDLEVAEETGPSDLVLSTGSNPPEGPTVAPGINIDLDDCAGFCPLVLDAQGDVAASLAGVRLASDASNLTLFQIKNIPDCRYVPMVCETLLGIPPGGLIAADVVADPDMTGQPPARLLNLTKLLPKEITEALAGSIVLPDMWLPTYMRGQKDNSFTFEAFFGVTEDGVIFRDTFVGEFDVQALTDSELGCALGLPNGSPLFTTDGNIGTLEWDVIGTVSEQVRTFTDPQLAAAADPVPAPQHIATLTNSDCGSSKSSSVRWSIKPYNMEVTPCTYNGDLGDVWATDGSCPVGGPEIADDAVFAKLLLTLFDEWKFALDQLACMDADGGGSPPLSAPTCSALSADWSSAKFQLDRCWEAAQKPKQSSGSQNCQSFVTQLNNLQSTLNGASLSGSDPANRFGELKARLLTIFHVHDERFVPSIPAAGFVEL